MSKRTELIRNAVAVIASFIISVFLIQFGLKLPNKLDERRAKEIRTTFCEHLLKGDMAGALALVPESSGKTELTRFLNQPGKVVECKDRGNPEPTGSPGPGDCQTLRQWMTVNRDPQTTATFAQSKGSVAFVYKCTSHSSWKNIESVFTTQWK